MCGITGIYSLSGEPIHLDEIGQQIETVVHRGPDQGGIYISQRHNCGMGIRRLSIVDVAGGQQPLSNEDDSIHLVYNGETYNHQPLRCELESLGHCPSTHSDAEAILHGYEAWGREGMLKRVRGMFAFSLWDEHRQQLLIARDRFGIKPLYYAEHAGRLYFGSEIKAILAEPTFPRRVNFTALQAFLTLGFVPGPATMFEGIYKLPAAHFLIAHEGSFKIGQYWQLDYQENRRISEGQAVEQFRSLLQESVQLRLMGEVPLGALLSGGLDSGTLVALTQAGLKKPLKTLSIGFEYADYDESALAGILADHLGTDHHLSTFTRADFELYPEVMYYLEEPQCSATALPIYKLYQACRRAGLTVVLTGEGADELLGGYHWHKGDSYVRPLLTLPLYLRRLIANSSLPMSPPARRVLCRGAQEIPRRYQDWLEVSDHGYRPKLLSGEANAASSHNGSNPLLTGWVEHLVGLKTRSVFHHTLWLESRTRLVDFINFEVDKMSMASSIEARVPYLDHKLWEFCATLPPAYKLKGRTEKYLLRRAAKDILPEVTRTREKMGLAAPYARWLQSKPLPDWAETSLSDSAIKRAGLFNPELVREMRRLHQSGKSNLGPLLMGVLSTQVWYDRFFN